MSADASRAGTAWSHEGVHGGTATAARQPQTSIQAWAGLGYVSVFSMFVGFVFWYRGLCAGGAASVAQLQAVQPLLGLVLAALVVGDEIPWDMPLVCVAVITCVVGAKHFAAPRPAGGDAGSVVAPTL